MSTQPCGCDDEHLCDRHGVLNEIEEIILNIYAEVKDSSNAAASAVEAIMSEIKELH